MPIESIEELEPEKSLLESPLAEEDELVAGDRLFRAILGIKCRVLVSIETLILPWSLVPGVKGEEGDLVPSEGRLGRGGEDRRGLGGEYLFQGGEEEEEEEEEVRGAGFPFPIGDDNDERETYLWGAGDGDEEQIIGRDEEDVVGRLK